MKLKLVFCILFLSIIIMLTSCETDVKEPNIRKPEKCDVGPAISCVDFKADINSITAKITNGIGQTMYNTTVGIPNCSNQAISDKFDIEKGSSGIFIIFCEGLKEGEQFESALILSYDTIIEGNLIHHERTGEKPYFTKIVVDER